MEKKIVLILTGIVLVLVFCAAGYTVYAANNPAVAAEKTKKVTDMMGRTVTIPSPVQKVVVIGSVPVQHSFIFALGKNGTIVNGLPDSFIKQGRWKYQYVFAPNLKDQPGMQSSTYEPNVEEIMKADPDVVFTMDPATVSTLDKSGLTVVYLSWVDNEDVKKLMTLMGEIYDHQDLADDYLDFFDSTITRVNDRVSGFPDKGPQLISQRTRRFAMEVKAVQPDKLVLVKDGAALARPVQGKSGDDLLHGTDLPAFTDGTSKESQII